MRNLSIPAFILLFFTWFGAAAQKKTVPKTPEKVYDLAEQMPVFRGGQDSLVMYLSRNINYPPEAYQNNIQGKVFLSFVVDTLGTVKDVKLLKSIDPFLDAEAMRVVKGMPHWQSGKDKGRKVSVKCILPVQFSIKLPPVQPPVDSVYTKVDTPAEYPGGPDAMLRFLGANVRYPKDAQANGWEGLVVATFVVEPTGEISELNIVKSLAPSMDQETARVIFAMPTWKPGLKNGKPVRVIYTLPVRFSIR